MQGISYLPSITGKGSQGRHRFLYWEFHPLGTRRAIRQGDWKLVQYNLHQDGQAELYHLERDPEETNNLASSHPDRVNAMIQLMNQHRQASPIFPNKALDTAMRDH